MSLEDIKRRHAGLLVSSDRVSFRCGEGWAGIIDQFLIEVEDVAAEFGHVGCVHLLNVGEHLGRLEASLWLSGAARDDAGFKDRCVALADGLRQRSKRVCEICGRPGRLRIDRTGWLGTRCDRHAPACSVPRETAE